MSRRRKKNRGRPGGTSSQPYTGPILRSGRFIEIDGEELEFTLPRNVVSAEEWQRLIEEGWELDERR